MPSTLLHPLKHLAQGGKIVLYDGLKPVRVKHIVHVDEHVSNGIIPILHGVEEAEVLYRKIVEVRLKLEICRLPVFSIFDSITPGANPCILERQWDDAL